MKYEKLFEWERNRIGPVSEVVTGMGSWEPEMCLLVEIRGLVCQLKPLTEEDQCVGEVYEVICIMRGTISAPCGDHV